MFEFFITAIASWTGMWDPDEDVCTFVDGTLNLDGEEIILDVVCWNGDTDADHAEIMSWWEAGMVFFQRYDNEFLDGTIVVPADHITTVNARDAVTRFVATNA